MKILIFLIFLYPSLGISQIKEFCDIAFSNPDNFKLLMIFNDKIPKTFDIIGETQNWNPSTFFLKDVNIANPEVMAQINKDEHHPYFSTYLFSIKDLDKLIGEPEKLELENEAQKMGIEKFKIEGTNYKTVEQFKNRKGFYFLITKPVYSKDGNYSFMQIFTKKKDVFLGENTDDYFCFMTIMFQKLQNQKWIQRGIKKHLIL